MARQALIVDLDGTVWDSLPWYGELVARRRPGKTAGTNAAKALKEAGWTAGRIATICQSGQPPLICYRGVIGALRAASSDGTAVGAVTNLPRWLAEPMVAAAGLAEHLGVLVGWGDTACHKPHPQPLLFAAKRLSVRPKDAWYVGDDPADAAAATSAGMRFAWASWGYGETEPANATRVLRTGEDLAGLLAETQ